MDLSKTFLNRQHGDIIACYTWINDERALVLIPALRKLTAWYIVLESAAFKYDDPHYLAKQCAIACDVLGIEPSKPNWVRVATIINEGLPDLVKMPSAPLPDPTEGSKHLGSIALKADGKLINEQEIKDNTGGVTYAI